MIEASCGGGGGLHFGIGWVRGPGSGTFIAICSKDLVFNNFICGRRVLENFTDIEDKSVAAISFSL
jgi:hypothetical protein